MPLEQEVLRRERAHQPGHQPRRAARAAAQGEGVRLLGTVHARRSTAAWTCPRSLQSLIWTEIGRTFVPFRFGGEADNILYYANDEQKAEYLIPTIEGERISCFAITEPGAGSDAANIKLSARPDGDDWILNGEKTFITNGNDADFAIVVAVTDREKGVRGGGTTAFLVDRVDGLAVGVHPDHGRGRPGLADLRQRPGARRATSSARSARASSSA